MQKWTQDLLDQYPISTRFQASVEKKKPMVLGFGKCAFTQTRAKPSSASDS